jgi:hypothetical protein
VAVRALLAVVAALLVAAPPAGASERSEARRYVAALEAYVRASRPALVAAVPEYHTRRSAVAGDCLTVAADGVSEDAAGARILLDGWAWQVAPLAKAISAPAERLVRRLGAIPTRTRVLRRGRAAFARSVRTGFAPFPLADALPHGPCAALRAWQAAGWTSDPPAELAPIDAAVRADDVQGDADVDPLFRAVALLKRHHAPRSATTALENTGQTAYFDALVADDPLLAATAG